MFTRTQMNYVHLVLCIGVLIAATNKAYAAPSPEMVACIVNHARELDDRISPADVIATAIKFSCRDYIDQAAKVVDAEDAKRLTYSDRRKVIEEIVFGFALISVLEGRVAHKNKE